MPALESPPPVITVQLSSRQRRETSDGHFLKEEHFSIGNYRTPLGVPGDAANGDKPGITHEVIDCSETRRSLIASKQASSPGLGRGQTAADHVALAAEAGHATQNRRGHGGRGVSAVPGTAASGSLLGKPCHLSSSPGLKQKHSLCSHRPSW